MLFYIFIVSDLRFSMGLKSVTDVQQKFNHFSTSSITAIVFDFVEQSTQLEELCVLISNQTRVKICVKICILVQVV